MRRTLKVLGVLVGLVVAFLVFAYWYDSVGQKADPGFVVAVAHPAYAGTTAPRVAFDVAHRNWHTPTERYRPLADLLRKDGYRVDALATPLSAEALRDVDILVIANAMGPDGHETQPAFTDAEGIALQQWVHDGGALLLIADHSPFGAAAAPLAKHFGVTMYLTYARDDDHHSGWDNERLLFSRANGLLPDSAITRGRTKDEQVSSVVTFTGQSLSVPAGATVLLRMSDVAYDWESRSVRTPAKGHAQGIAMQVGAGRVVVLGEAGMLSAQVDPLGFKMGMNTDGNDNRQFALNVFHWLSGALR
ncbi:hypothetical protein LYSHEL_20330 [Lysobacter helvus]|uniref:DUF4350 domain-containing protein n=2 Tax=Lysobacteraceae TaxID=32033 RepID=A0ABN6FUG8_9GAMM|nr:MULTISPECIES: DUF4350 domain-containing protein [Lysobacter]BCT93010.1 hypothetical protein LYSCAS_20340 [Lysobacter caseinilyticus]BCT96162.1 hypothetical protein LYSHEL_20330 [Lysobacter helvus]